MILQLLQFANDVGLEEDMAKILTEGTEIKTRGRKSTKIETAHRKKRKTRAKITKTSRRGNRK